MAEIKVIVFDIGGTLMEYRNMPLSWLDYYREGFCYVREKLNLPITDEDIEISYEIMKKYNPRINYREIDYSPQVIFREVTAHWKGDFKLEDVIAEFFVSMNLSALIYPETCPCLKKLKTDGYTLAALSDVAIGMPDELHKSYFAELLPFFDRYVSSISCGWRKPNPKGLCEIAEQYHVTPDEMIMVGDEEKDIKTAKRFGCKSILIERNGENRNFGQDYVIENVCEMEDILWILRNRQQ